LFIGEQRDNECCIYILLHPSIFLCFTILSK
jgi:hypothetical protein